MWNIFFCRCYYQRCRNQAEEDSPALAVVVVVVVEIAVAVAVAVVAEAWVELVAYHWSPMGCWAFEPSSWCASVDRCWKQLRLLCSLVAPQCSSPLLWTVMFLLFFFVYYFKSFQVERIWCLVWVVTSCSLLLADDWGVQSLAIHFFCSYLFRINCSMAVEKKHKGQLRRIYK